MSIFGEGGLMGSLFGGNEEKAKPTEESTTLLGAANKQEEARTKDNLIEDPTQKGKFITKGEYRARQKGPLPTYNPITDTTKRDLPRGY